MSPQSFGIRVSDTDPLESRNEADRKETGSEKQRPRSRLALGFSPTPRPGLILLPLGAALGPYGLNLLSQSAFSYLDPVVSVTLAAVGAVVALGSNLRRPLEGLLFVAAGVEAGLTAVLVAAGVLVIHSFWLSLGQTPWLFALMLGLCASVSSTVANHAADDRPSMARRIGDLDDVLPIVLGGLALAAIRDSSLIGITSLMAGSTAVVMMIAFAGWLLVSQTSSESEQHVFVAGALLLLGGAAAYLSLSALVAGFVAGMVWNAAGGSARDRFDQDMRHLQHPLVVLLLLIAGTWFSISVDGLIIAVAYVVCRTIGKLAGGWMARRIIQRDVPRDLGISLLAPGVTGIAFALNALQASGDSDRNIVVLAVVSIGSLASELLSFGVRAREGTA